MVENLNAEFSWKAIAERIAHRCKMRDMLQQVIAEKPAVRNIHIAFPPRLAQGRNTE